MGKTNGYIYQVENKIYVLVPDVIIGLKRVHLQGCSIHDLRGGYIGYWSRTEMPTELVHHVTRWFREQSADEINARRTAAMMKKPRPRI